MTNFDIPEQGKRRSRAESRAAAEETIERLAGEPTDKYLSAGRKMELVERDLLIWRAHLNCVDDFDLGASFDLSPAHVRKIIARQRRENLRLSQRDPVEVVEELSDKIDAAISELSQAGGKETGSVRITAIMGRINSLIQKGKWLQSAGLLPQEASELRVHMTASNMAQNILTVLEERDLLTPELMQDIHLGLGQGDIIDAEGEEMTEEMAEEELPA